jgi:hypothetical protein
MQRTFAPYVYHTSVDRVGLAIAFGGALCGALAAGLLAVGGQTDPVAIVMAGLIGSLLATLAITAVAVPIWLFMHLAGRRRPSHAALVGALTAFVIFAAAQTHGFGLGDAPPSDMATLMFRWASAAATSLVLALVAALIALVMWRIAYRRVPAPYPEN